MKERERESTIENYFMYTCMERERQADGQTQTGRQTETDRQRDTHGQTERRSQTQRIGWLASWLVFGV